jgi:predicted transcriptional regulator
MSSENQVPLDRGLVTRLGELELAVLEYVWEAPETSAKEAHAAMGVKRGISLNTVQSTLERLHRKQLLTRRKVRHAYVYDARLPRARLVAQLIQDLLKRFGTDAASTMAAFVEAAEHVDEEALSALEAQLEARRLRGEGK